jgi:hypothetical protein
MQCRKLAPAHYDRLLKPTCSICSPRKRLASSHLHRFLTVDGLISTRPLQKRVVKTYVAFTGAVALQDPTKMKGHVNGVFFTIFIWGIHPWGYFSI